MRRQKNLCEKTIYNKSSVVLQLNEDLHSTCAFVWMGQVRRWHPNASSTSIARKASLWKLGNKKLFHSFMNTFYNKQSQNVILDGIMKSNLHKNYEYIKTQVYL